MQYGSHLTVYNLWDLGFNMLLVSVNAHLDCLYKSTEVLRSKDFCMSAFLWLKFVFFSS